MSPEAHDREDAGPCGCVPSILTFHKITTTVSYGVSNYSPRRLDRLLECLRIKDFYPAALSLEDGARPRKEFAITFDDGYRHLLDALPPLIEKYSLKPVVFVPTAFMGKPNSWDYSHALRNTLHLNRSEIQELASMGVEFGSHGHRHIDLTRCRSKELKAELSHSKQALEDVLGRDIFTISYPYGRFNRIVTAAAGEVGYRLGLTMRFPSSKDGPLELGRYPVYSFDSWRAVLRKLELGSWVGLDRLKARIIGSLSAGTDILNRLRRFDST